MNQQREVIYSLRAFALEGGEELRAEAISLVEKALGRRVESTLQVYDDGDEWDLRVLQQDLLMHYLISLRVPDAPTRTSAVVDEMKRSAIQAGRKAFDDKMRSFGENADRVLSLVTLNVLDEKWKDHLYDLEQFRNAIHYRSWGQKDPLIEYKHESYTMFVDLMADIAHTFAERFLRVQLLAQNEPPQQPRPARRFNALGVVEEDSPPPVAAASADGDGRQPAAPVSPVGAPRVVGRGLAGPTRVGPGVPGVAGGADWSRVGRNDPCPCGSGKKFKKCHGASL
jgi:preprotein translocase subunit SecA